MMCSNVPPPLLTRSILLLLTLPAQVLAPPLGQRDERALRSLARALAKKFAFFGKLPPVLRRDLVAELRLSRHPKGRMLFRQGTVGRNFYVLLSGEVSVEVADATQAIDELKTKVVALLRAGQGFGASL